VPARTFPSAAAIIERGIAARAFPGATIAVGGRDEVRWSGAFGRFTYAPDAPRVTPETVYDLASLTKVIATTTRAMEAVEAGVLTLDARVGKYLTDWRGADREAVTVADLLEHASGLTAYLPFFRDHRGRPEFQRAVCTLPLEYAPRTQAIYSDLGFILLGFILADVGLPLEDFPPKAEALRFLPPRDWKDRCAPTELDLWRGRLLQGEVHDENAWVLGGVAGHAGVFGTSSALAEFARDVLKGLQGETTFARAATFARFAVRSTVKGSSRALGWDTMLPTSSCGTRLSARALGHTGFTGTSLWIDPDQDLYVVFLTNRVHPSRDNNAIQPVRRALHDAIVEGMRL